MKASIWVGLTSLGMAAVGIVLPVLLGASNSERWRSVAAVDADGAVLDEPPGRVGETRKPRRSLALPKSMAPSPRAQQEPPWLTRIADWVAPAPLQRAAVAVKRERRPRSW